MPSKNLFLMRHGQAATHQQDCQVPLSSVGEKQTQAMAKQLSQLETPPKHILSSPYVRTWQTAQRVHQAIPGSCLESADWLLPSALDRAADEAMTVLLMQPQAVLLVSHHPVLMRLLAALLQSSAPERHFPFPPATCCWLQSDYHSDSFGIRFWQQPENISF